MGDTKRVGVLGAGSFGIAISNLIAKNRDVLIYARKTELSEKINQQHEHLGVKLSERIVATSNIEEIASNCTLLFPIVPSHSFRDLIQQLSPYLKPYHIIIHLSLIHI